MSNTKRTDITLFICSMCFAGGLFFTSVVVSKMKDTIKAHEQEIKRLRFDVDTMIKKGKADE